MSKILASAKDKKRIALILPLECSMVVLRGMGNKREVHPSAKARWPYGRQELMILRPCGRSIHLIAKTASCFSLMGLA